MRKFQVMGILEDVSTAKICILCALKPYFEQKVILGEDLQNVFDKIGGLRDADQADMRPSKLARGLGVVAMQLYR
jgi:hypothetical protein